MPKTGLCYANTVSNAGVHALFDDIKYAKGSAALRMLWDYMYTGAGSDHYAIARLTHMSSCSMNLCPKGHDAHCADAESDREVQALFDDIEYAKGGAVLRMLWNYMSSDHYAIARLPANVPLGHDNYVRLS